MGSQAKFGVFSPAVYAAKIALGNDKLNKIRGQAISLHSQYIGDFCTWAGAYHLRTKLIKKVSCWMGKITLTYGDASIIFCHRMDFWEAMILFVHKWYCLMMTSLVLESM